MANRTIVPRGRGRSVRRKSLWLAFAQVFTVPAVVGASTALLLSSLNAGALALRPFTVIRTRGIVYMATDQDAADEVPFGAFGFATVSDQASAIGVTAVPTPTTDAGSSLWFSWTPWVVDIRVPTQASIASVGQPYIFDSKAMRKVEVGEDIVMMVENQSSSSGATLIALARMLIKTN